MNNMVVRYFLIIISLFYLTTLQLLASTYYLDSSFGNDSSNGTSVYSPWRTIGKINNSNFQPGDSILFKRDEIWKEYLNFPSSGNAFAPIIIGSYGEGSLPIISGVNVYEGWDNPFNWISVGNNIWSREQSFNPQRMWINGDEVLRNEEIDSLDGVRYMWAWENALIYVFSEINPATAFNFMEVNVFLDAVRLGNQNNITIQDIEIQGGYGYGLAIRGCSNIIVKNSNIGAFSRQGIQIRDNQGISSTYVTIDNCVLDSKFSFSYGKNKGIDDGIQITTGANNCIIKNSVIKDFGHAGIYLIAVNASDNGVYDNKIFGNYITGKNVTYQRGIGTDGYENKCRDNEFFNNVIKNTTVRSQINGNNNWIHHNIVDGVTNSIVKSWGVGQAFDLQCYGTDLVCHDNKIDNNLIMNCDEPGITLSGNGGSKESNFIRNNIIINCGRNSKEGLENIGISIENDNSIKTNYFYNNSVFNGDENQPVVFLRGHYITIEHFNGQTVTVDVALNNIQKDPLFETSDSSSFLLAENSPCIDAGIDVGLAQDFYGNGIFNGFAPDIGIHEYHGTTNIVSNNLNEINGYKLEQNYPNPFNPTTQISYQIPKDGFVNLAVYNSLGQIVSTLVNNDQPSGKYSVKFTATGLSSGVYFYKLKSRSFTKVNKMLLLR
jgi:signal peptidase I